MRRGPGPNPLGPIPSVLDLIREDSNLRDGGRGPIDSSRPPFEGSAPPGVRLPPPRGGLLPPRGGLPPSRGGLPPPHGGGLPPPRGGAPPFGAHGAPPPAGRGAPPPAGRGAPPPTDHGSRTSNPQGLVSYPIRMPAPSHLEVTDTTGGSVPSLLQPQKRDSPDISEYPASMRLDRPR